MSLEAYPFRVTEPEVYKYYFNGEGNAGANLTKTGGSNAVTSTRTGVGAYVLTWDHDPGQFLTFNWSLASTTPANLENHMVIGDSYDAVNKQFTFQVSVGTSGNDLVATESVFLQIEFQRTTA